uniref:Uncharacterized protein n=1 Tax=viral metagenome TaxID=1070528 RepID=A0A6M3JT28_9ZZZZ
MSIELNNPLFPRMAVKNNVTNIKTHGRIPQLDKIDASAPDFANHLAKKRVADTASFMSFETLNKNFGVK